MNKYTTYQKVVLSIYALVSLPLLPVMAIVYPAMIWVVSGKVQRVREITLIDFLSFTMAFATLTYLVVWLLHVLPPG